MQGDGFGGKQEAVVDVQVFDKVGVDVPGGGGVGRGEVVGEPAGAAVFGEAAILE